MSPSIAAALAALKQAEAQREAAKRAHTAHTAVRAAQKPASWVQSDAELLHALEQATAAVVLQVQFLLSAVEVEQFEAIDSRRVLR